MNPTDPTAALRARAEAMQQQKNFQTAHTAELPTTAALMAQTHDLQVHQIELEMQNEALSESQALLDTARSHYFELYDMAPVAYCTVNREGLIVESNQTLSILLGFEKHKVIMKPFNRFIMPDDQDTFYLFYKRLIKTLEERASDTPSAHTPEVATHLAASSCELRMQKLDSTSLWVQVSATTPNSASDALDVRLALTDISERKQAELSLQQSQRELEAERFSQAVLDSLSAQIAVLDGAGDIIATNHQWKLFAQKNGVSAVSLIDSGANYLSACYAAMACGEAGGAEAVALLGDLLSGRRLEGSFEYPCHAPHKQRWFICRGSRFSGDGAVRVVISHENITLRKLAELKLIESNNTLEERVVARTAQLAEREARLAESQRIAHIGSWTWDLQDAVEWSAETYRIFGLTPETFTPTLHGLLQLIHPQDQTQVKKWLQACIDNVNPGEIEYRVILPDGAVRYLLGQGEINPLAKDIARQMHGTVQDITSRKQTEQELRDAKGRAERTSEIKDAFLATMSHEIRTPLGGLLGMLELLSLTPLDAEQNDTLKTAQNAGAGLLRIVNDILDWSTIEQGQLALNPHPSALAQLLSSVAEPFARAASANNVILSQSMDARLSAVVIVDALRLAQVLNNFVSNAIKFSNGGRVDLRAELIERIESVGLTAAAERICFSVKDTGIGIALADQSRLFKNYSQVGGDTSRMYGGTGLGLAITKRLATMMGGQITFNSDPNCGSTFSITLTLSIAKIESNALTPTSDGVDSLAVISSPVAEPRHAVAPVDRAGPLILVVDDNDINRKLLSRQLTLLGYRYETAEDGKVALAKWQAGDYALVITDCHMPVMNGYELTQAIRHIEADRTGARTKILAWTANALPEEREKCRIAGMDDVLTKPTNLSQVKAALESFITGDRATHPPPLTTDSSFNKQ